MYQPGQYTAPVDQELEDLFGRTDGPFCHVSNLWDHPSNIDRLSEKNRVILNSASLACHIFFIKQSITISWKCTKSSPSLLSIHISIKGVILSYIMVFSFFSVCCTLPSCHSVHMLTSFTLTFSSYF